MVSEAFLLYTLSCSISADDVTADGFCCALMVRVKLYARWVYICSELCFVTQEVLLTHVKINTSQSFLPQLYCLIFFSAFQKCMCCNFSFKMSVSGTFICNCNTERYKLCRKLCLKNRRSLI